MDNSTLGCDDVNVTELAQKDVSHTASSVKVYEHSGPHIRIF